ncbi:hypothetical protein BGX29_010526 [Mortierella sp. GBA35]|nr:hypothetical protein BGX29_010526 [Mortierella sp. GBA35]KAF9099702.1 hypothetical protein BGX23_000076 [Mortierella sp. AD031]KAG0220052.1 hypothetical protein BGX33_009604 [Mortierella sp. NVP41]
MVNKAPKPAKAPKANKRSKNQAPGTIQTPFFAEDSLFGRSQKFVQENDAKPFRDFGYFVAAILIFLIWRYYAAITDGRSAAVSVWGFLTVSMIALINLWTYFLVLISARRGGDIGIVKIVDEDIHRFMWISGLFGAWAGIIWFGYAPRSPKFFAKASIFSVFSLMWVAVGVKLFTV